ncbi:DUF4327 family protein [Leptolyngbya sp. FACHB-261]|uniref:DUF4327 family protein n=1 Tax=Leptolyngbya sp. FACHB-261 TaxID=2692806 RepID=UPI0016825279|nr:DUF4327 family protein [Leptolyngbya sp. FACHB-261]MBD2099445.1 DUF4327 family protein [Leptolyngbya sp. FACHB-261]
MVQSFQFSLATIQDEARHLVDAGVLNPRQPIHVLCQYFPAREWQWVERELELHDYLLRDRLSDLMSHEEWGSD